MIAVDWSGYPSQEYHVLRASLVCDGRSIPLLSQIVPSAKQQNAQVQKDFLNALHRVISPDKKVIIVPDAGFQNAWFRHIRSLGWDFMGRVRGNIQLRLKEQGGQWREDSILRQRTNLNIWGQIHWHALNTLSVTATFVFIKKRLKDEKKRGRCRISRYSQEQDGRASAKEPWLIFSSTDEFSPVKIMKLYSRRMQIEQNFRDEKK